MIEPERVSLQQLEALFHELLGLAPPERAAALRSLALREPAVAAELESLLAAGDVEVRLAAQRVAEAGRDAGRSPHPRLVGPYQLDRLLGRGGMGAVHLAHRVDGQFEQQVAVKLIDLPLATELFRERFRQERQIMAALVHPFIARLLDGGVTEAGEPYLAMEYVDGVPITVHCLRAALPLRGRLELFQRVCSAVQFAHQNLVVHRDLKPDNIFVLADGTPRLLDFGTAKLLVPVPAQAPDGLTQHGLQYFTPQFASPEQVLGAPITTATDTYSLGVLLYLLITGVPPYEMRECTTAEMLRLICEAETPRPSAAAPTVDCAAFRIDADLDAIVRKALRKEPAARYLTVDHFQADIGAWLAGRPVLARRGSWRYRVFKFARRNTLALTAAAVVAVSVLAGVVGVVWQARLADQARQRAEARSQDLRELSNSLLSEIDEAIKELPGSTPVQRLLVARVLDHLDRMSTDADVDMVTRLDLVSAYTRLGNLQGNPYEQNIGDSTGAIRSLDKAIRLARSLQAAAPGDPQALAALANAEQSSGEVLFGIGRTDEAIAVMRLAVASFEARLQSGAATARDFADAASAVGGLGDQLGQTGVASLGDQAGALQSYRRALQLSERALGLEPGFVRSRRGVAIDYLKIGNVLLTTEPVKALEDYRRSLAEWQALPQEDQAAASTRRGIAQTHLKIAAAQAALGDFPQAFDEFALATPTLLLFARADPDDSRASYELADLYAAEALVYVDMLEPALNPHAATQRTAPRRALDLLAQSSAILRRLLAVNPLNDGWLASVAHHEVLAGSLALRYGLGGAGGVETARAMARLVELADSPDASLDTLNIAVAARASVLPSRLRDAAWTAMHAQRAADLTRHRNPSLLLALARACRAAGDVPRATQAAGEGLDLLRAAQPAARPTRLFRLLTLAADPGRTDVGWGG